MSKYTATLVDGRVYTLMIPNEKNPRQPESVTFEGGVAKPVTDKVKKMLEEQAIQEVTVGSGKRKQNENRCKFTFEKIEASTSEAVRSRSAPATTEG